MKKIPYILGSLLLIVLIAYGLYRFNRSTPAPTNESAMIESQSDESMTSDNTEIPEFESLNRDQAIQILPEDASDESSEVESTNETTDTAVEDPSIYRLDVMESNHKEFLDASQYGSVDEVIEEVIANYGLSPEMYSIAYYNFVTDEHYYNNEDNYIVAASTAKVPAAMAYIDMIEAGTYTYDSHLPFDTHYLYEGAGNIANAPAQDSYAISDLLREAITHSDNTAWYTLVFNYPNNFGGIASYIQDRIGFYDIPSYFYMDNYGSAYIYEQLLMIVATDPTYQPLVDLMRQTEPNQLFTSYIQTDRMANKYGRIDGQVNDVGIYYENEEPQYILVAYTDGAPGADSFLEDLNLNVNQWFRSQYLLNQ